MKDESGVCANCGDRIYRSPTGTWKHCYTVSDKCVSRPKKVMPRQC